MKVAVIGGAGFIGTRLCGILLDRGYALTILDIRPSPVYPEKSLNVDVRSLPELKQGLEGHDAVINLAAVHKDNIRPVSLYYDVNVQGARNICAAAADLEITTMIFTSSVAVYGFAPANTNESGLINPFSDYGRSKWQAEEVFRRWARDDARRALTVVRPTVVFGPRNRGNVYNLLSQIASGRFLMVGNGRNVKSMAFVDNVAGFLMHSLSTEPGEHLYNYVDKPDLSMNDLVKLVHEFLPKTRTASLRVPYFVGYSAAKLLDLVALFLKREFSISSIRVKKFCSTTQFDAEKINSTDFVPPVSIAAALRHTIDFEFGNTNQSSDTDKKILFFTE